MSLGFCRNTCHQTAEILPRPCGVSSSGDACYRHGGGRAAASGWGWRYLEAWLQDEEKEEGIICWAACEGSIPVDVTRDKTRWTAASWGCHLWIWGHHHQWAGQPHQVPDPSRYWASRYLSQTGQYLVSVQWGGLCSIVILWKTLSDLKNVCTSGAASLCRTEGDVVSHNNVFSHLCISCCPFTKSWVLLYSAGSRQGQLHVCSLPQGDGCAWQLPEYSSEKTAGGSDGGASRPCLP